MRIDTDLKIEFANICKEISLNMNAVIDIFANAVMNKRKIPFKIEVSIISNENFKNLLFAI